MDGKINMCKLWVEGAIAPKAWFRYQLCVCLFLSVWLFVSRVVQSHVQRVRKKEREREKRGKRERSRKKKKEREKGREGGELIDGWIGK